MVSDGVDLSSPNARAANRARDSLSDSLSTLSVVGVSHHSCPVEVREKFALTDTSATAEPIKSDIEHVWLSTCNRTEMYSVLRGESRSAETVFANTLNLPSDFVGRHTYVKVGIEAVQHLFRVASGLESLVVGEDEILRQVRQALSSAQDKGKAGPVLERAFQSALSVGKRVRTETEINRYPASLSAAAVSILREGCGLGSLRDLSVLVIGAGDMGRAVTRCLKGMDAGGVAVANRTYARAKQIAHETGSVAVHWPLRPDHLAQYDAVISCTGSPDFVLTRNVVQKTLALRSRAGSVQLIDMAVPRDIEPNVCLVPGVQLKNIDDARSVVEDTVSKRAQYVEPAERIIDEHVDGFTEWMAGRSVSDAIRIMREHANRIRLNELDWLMPKLSALSTDDRDMVRQFSTRLVNKLLHMPTTRLRETGGQNEFDSVSELVLHLFDAENDAGHNGCRIGVERTSSTEFYG